MFNKNRAISVFDIKLDTNLRLYDKYRKISSTKGFLKSPSDVFWTKVWGIWKCDFYSKKVKQGDLLLQIRKSTWFLNLLILPCLFQFHRKHKNSIRIQNIYTLVGKYLKVVEIFTKKWTLVFDTGRYCSTFMSVLVVIGINWDSRGSRKYEKKAFLALLLILGPLPCAKKKFKILKNANYMTARVRHLNTKFVMT